MNALTTDLRKLLMDAPRVSAADPAEEPQADVIDRQLLQLATCTVNFGAALEIRQTALTQRALMAWLGVAGRDGSVTLWNFQQAMSAIKRALDTAPTLRATVKVADIVSTASTFYQKFPDFKRMRDAVGHASELAKSPQAMAANAGKPNPSLGLGTMRLVAGPGQATFHDSFMGDTFFTTGFEGDVVKYDLSEASLQVLVEITRQIFAAFPPPQYSFGPPGRPGA